MYSKAFIKQLRAVQWAQDLSPRAQGLLVDIYRLAHPTCNGANWPPSKRVKAERQAYMRECEVRQRALLADWRHIFLASRLKKPGCYGQYRGGNTQAERDCGNCNFIHECTSQRENSK